MGKARNVLVLMSDEHSARIMGCAGHLVRTPTLDRLASRGTRFPAASTNSPICVPARAAFATGRYVFETGCWDNAFPYFGQLPSWAHWMRESAVPSVAIGKLHFRRAGDDNGFVDEIDTMHLREGIGDVLGAVRDPPAPRPKGKAVALEIGAGESSYTEYDRRVTRAACEWIGKHAARGPWTLFVGWVAPHFPLIAPREFFDLYDPASLPLPKASRPAQWPDHPWLDTIRECFGTDRHFTDETRRIALAAYYGLISFMDSNVARVLAALEESGASRETVVVYTSDHGDNMGARGLWGKSTLYAESVGIPLIASGPGFAEDALCATAVSLVDATATIVEAAGCAPMPQCRGESLAAIAARPDDPDRTAFSEYHAAGAASGAFMLRDGHYKLVHYVGMRSQLFDLRGDPEELVDLADDPNHQAIVAQLRSKLGLICDPEAVDRAARAAQRALVESHGGRERVMARGGFGASPVPEATTRADV